VIVGGATAVSTSALAKPVAAIPSGFDSPVEAAAMNALKDGACPGVQVSVWQDGKSVLSRSFGRANIETATPVSANSIFRIGSLTKQFTAAAIIKLAADGRLRIEDPVARFLPAMARLPEMSLLELMNHTAGLHDDGQEESRSRGTASQEQLAVAIASQAKPLDFAPGTAWLYSNANYIVLGAVIEKVTGVPLAEALAALIFRPLGLRKSAVDKNADVVPNRASGYTPVDGGKGKFVNADYIDISDAGGAGAMRSAASDLCMWHTALLSGKLFAQPFVKLMTTPGRLRDGRVSGANRFSPEDANYGGVQYACGLLVQSSGPNGRVISHNGFINGFSAVLESYVDRRLTFAVLCNADVGPRLPFRAIRRALNEQLN
jgi:CubicO group peptidase (beta-lactamase class C family)